MTDEGMYFIGGAFSFYVLAIPLFVHMLEPEDPEENASGPIKFAFMWPIVALEVIYQIFVGEKNDDGTGPN